MKIFSDEVNIYLQENNDKELDSCRRIIKNQLQYVHDFIERALKENISLLNTAARDLSFSMVHIYVGKIYCYCTSSTTSFFKGSLLIYHATKKNSTECDRNTAIR